jgi:hypothetical protein
MTPDRYLCPGCQQNYPLRPPAREPEYDTVWRPGKDAPSLTGDAKGLGSTLAGSDFLVHR